MLRLWDAFIACSAMLGIVITALGIMLQIIEVPQGMRRIGALVGCAILLVILPPVIVSIWLRLALKEQIGVCAICGMVVALMLRQRKGEPHHRRRP